MNDLYAQFRGVRPAGSGETYSAIQLHGLRRDFLAKSADGAPIFLLQDVGRPAYVPGVVLRHVSARFHVTCSVQAENLPASEGQFAIITCEASVPELHELFIRCVSSAAESLPLNAETPDIERCVQTLLNLFRSMSIPSEREIVGLWAELFVISMASDIVAATRAWHADCFEKFDFSWPDCVLEVKATQGDIRSHEFALDQLTIPPDGSGFVVSVLVRPMTGGVGVMELAKQIEDSLGPNNDLRKRLWSNVARALGNEFGERLDRRFDQHFGAAQLALFDMRDIPAPMRSPDPRVSNIRFRADLNTVSSSVLGSPGRALRALLER